MNKLKNKKLVIIIIILLIGSFLRLYKLSQVPPSLFGDELEVGYQAYSVLKTGRDYYGNFLPVEFHSLAEWRTPLYIYSSIPTVALFGITPLGVRLPAVFFGILGIFALYLLTKELLDDKTALAAAFLLSISPWHLQYSRAAFEVTEMLVLILFALYFFLIAVKRNSRILPLSALTFGLIPWVYNSGKLFTPLIIIALTALYCKKLVKLNVRHIFLSVAVLFVVVLPVAVNSIFGGGAERFAYLSIFSDTSIEETIGNSRSYDSLSRNAGYTPLAPQVSDKMFHNKIFYWGSQVFGNYAQALSLDTLFVNGDPNPRHTVPGVGLFYRVDMVLLASGMFFIIKKRRTALLVGLWILLSTLPASLTKDGGAHATRLILLLPPLIITMAYGLRSLFNKSLALKTILFVYLFSLSILVIGYLHTYYVHYSYQSEQWWHAGYADALRYIQDNEYKYRNVVLSTAKEPPWVFFAAWTSYPPGEWQNKFPMENKLYLAGFGEVSHISKYYFGSPKGENIYDWGKVLDNKTLYLASSDEVKVNLIKEPERTPGDILLLHVSTYPSGEPAFYIFTGKHEI